MIEYIYLVALLVSIAGLATLDWRYKLVFWRDKTQATYALVVFMAIFVVWDIAGILLGVFMHGGSEYSLSLRILPEFPLEELMFLELLFYTTAELMVGASRWRRI